MSLLERQPSAPTLYSQVEARLLERLRRDFRPGQMLPTQQELAREFGASLITIKRALHELARRGHLQATRGRGTVVTRPVVSDDRSEVSSWTDAMSGLGREPRTVESSVQVHRPSRDLARLLGLRSRERSIRLERLRSLDGRPFCLMSNELPFALAPELADHGLPEESLYAWLRRQHRLVPQRADEEVHARGPLPRESRFLGRDVPIVIVVRRHTFLSDGRPLEVAEMVADARQYRYRVEIAKKP
ncbi:MAG TPA: GntR family transcriptional regulator [Planctomycetota bacterium]|nr:GntR family transcriptional regulator [Planctomycetota bacterium]